MIEYTITHTFDQFRSNFSKRKGKKRGKTHFFQQQNAFFKIRENGLFFTYNVSMERS